MPTSVRVRLLQLSPDQRLLLGMLLLVTCLYTLLARDSYTGDFRAYYVAAQASHAGLDPYQNQINVDERYADGDWLYRDSRFIYPPSALLFFAPLGHLSYRTAKVIFPTFMALLMAGLLFTLSRRYPRAGWMALALFLSLPMASNIDNGQVDVLILVLGLAAFFARSPVLGGSCLGVAIAIKMSPVLILLWLMANRRWLTTLYATCVAGMLTLAATRIWGVGLYGEFLAHMRHHLAAGEPMLTHQFHDNVVVLGRFVVMGSSTYSLHYFFGTRQNPLLPLGSMTAAAGLMLVAAYLIWTTCTRPGRFLRPDANFFGFLVIALFANALLWPAGLVACFPLTMLLVQRSRAPVEDGMLLLLPFFAPLAFIADRRFLFWLIAAAWCCWQETKRRTTQQKDLTWEVLDRNTAS